VLKENSMDWGFRSFPP